MGIIASLVNMVKLFLSLHKDFKFINEDINIFPSFFRYKDKLQ